MDATQKVLKAGPAEALKTCFTEPVTCECPNGQYQGLAGWLRLLDIVIHYYAPPRWARWVIGVTLFLWILPRVVAKCLEFAVKVARFQIAREKGNSWRQALSVFDPEPSQAVKAREAFEKEMTQGL
ncbi:hypothetical protein C8034_v000253 [Colletotrichum sidae]|uniref:Uncharacterized protein n=2 Tax=Colletotrichum orbiculare species complex TaxID=2707354 RepID=N4V4Y9_COLOR|nr:hypothetical protein Cob_v013090 [Colletotrichum orbiculare MAFF 240422]TEA17181.1 hypothetical protein C8034_v000253 [Colletotrichum sidae]